jgi:hypothetical protein
MLSELLLDFGDCLPAEPDVLRSVCVSLCLSGKAGAWAASSLNTDRREDLALSVVAD